MAPRMKWLLVTLGSCVAIALLVLVAFDPMDRGAAPDSVLNEAGQREWRHPLVQSMRRIEDELRETNEILVQQQTLEHALAALPESPGVVQRELPPHPRFDLDSAARADPYYVQSRIRSDSMRLAMRRAIEAQVAEEGGTRARIAVVQVPLLAREDVDVPFAGFDAVRYFAGQDSLGGYCIVTYSSVLQMAMPNLLGPCRLWLRYGAPSPAVLDWIAKSGHLLLYERPDWPSMSSPSRRMLFGIRGGGPERPYAALTAEACLAGREEVCTAAAFDAAMWSFRPTPDGKHALHVEWAYDNPDPTGALFGDLERALGRDRFGDFWRNAGQPRAELEAALGVGLDRWIMEWLRDRIGREPLGPRVPAGTLLTSLLTVAALVAAGFLVAMRRQAV